MMNWNLMWPSVGVYGLWNVRQWSPWIASFKTYTLHRDVGWSGSDTSPWRFESSDGSFYGGASWPGWCDSACFQILQWAALFVAGVQRTAPTSSSNARWLRRHGGGRRWPDSPWPLRRRSGAPCWEALSDGRWIGGGSSPLCGRFGSTGTRSSSGASPRPVMPLHIQLRDFIFLGTEVAMAPRTLYPRCDRPCCCTIFISSMKSGGTVRGASLSQFKKKWRASFNKGDR